MSWNLRNLFGLKVGVHEVIFIIQRNIKDKTITSNNVIILAFKNYMYELGFNNVGLAYN